MDRRQFLLKAFALCSISAIGTRHPSLAAPRTPAPTSPAQSQTGSPENGALPEAEEKVAFYISKDEVLRSSHLPVGQAYVFHYPFVSTPALLINLGARVPNIPNMMFAEQKIIDSKLIVRQTPYQWSGGAGRAQNLVAYSAICPHDLVWASKEVNLFNYRHRKTNYYAPQDKVITCCSHGSAFDVQNGGIPILGPAKRPLTAIKLAFDPQTDSLSPDGFEGHNLFSRFLRKNRKDLKYEFGKNYNKPVHGKIILTPIEKFAEKTVRCT